MAATMWIEMDSGTGCGPQHPHNGYWAGDFAVPSGADEPEGNTQGAP
jgi:hypothetical protein